MATRARFGRLPRSAPSLTSTIVSLAQQYQSGRDRNIETAWKEGGLFEGKKVTDSLFLNHWRERLKSVSKDDPMWDYYNNLIYSYEFAVAESKMGLKYAEKTVTDRQMAAFYREWAVKLPQDSEAYRRLMTQAAKFKEASVARSYGNSARTARDNYNRAQAKTYNTEEAPYDVAMSLIAQYAVMRGGILDVKDLDDPDFGWSKLSNSEGGNDPENFSKLLVSLTSDPAYSAAIAAEIRKYDPTFSGSFSRETLTQLANKARNGASTRGRRARKAGAKGDANAADDAAARYSHQAAVTAVSLGDTPDSSFVEQDMHWRAEMDAVLNNPGATPLEQSVAIKKYRNWLAGSGTKILVNSLPAGSLQPGSKTFNPTAAGIMGRLTATINTLDGKPTGLTTKDDVLATSGAEPGPGSDAAKLSGYVNALSVGLDHVARGQGILVRTNADGKIDPKGTGWSIFDRNDPDVVNNSNLVPVVVPAHGTYVIPGTPGRSVNVEPGMVPLGQPAGTFVGGEAGEVRYEVAVDVKVRAFGGVDPVTGRFMGPVDPAEGQDTVIGKQVTITGPDGVSTPIYGTYVAGGKLVWGKTNPFREDGLQATTTDKDGSIIRQYAIPAPITPRGEGEPKNTFSPQGYINPAALQSPATNPDWNPATDKQTVYDSPWAALANRDDFTNKYVSDMGDSATHAVESEWFRNSNNWTDGMKQQYDNALQLGTDPDQAFAGVVSAKASELPAMIKYQRASGFTPEAQTAYRGQVEQQAMSARGMGPAEYRQFLAQDAAEKQRKDLVGDLDAWGINNPRRTFVPGYLTPGQAWTPGQTVQESPLPKGWSAKDLLTQPGLSVAQANDIAARITNGALGSRLPDVPGGRMEQGRGRYATRGTAPAQNPYLPQPGQLPAGGPSTPWSRPYTPPQMVHTPTPAPRPTPVAAPIPKPPPGLSMGDYGVTPTPRPRPVATNRGASLTRD